MTFDELEELNGGFAASRVLHAGVELDLFSALTDGATAEEAATARQLDPRATELLLNALTGLGTLTKQDGRFELTDTSRRWLLPDSPTPYGDMVHFDAQNWVLWQQLADSVRTGSPARTPDMFQTRQADTHRFIHAMHGLVAARGDANWVAANLPMTGKVLDVGSGPGTYPMAFCQHNKNLAATIFDLPGTLEITRDLLAQEGFADRIDLVAGDYNEVALPDGYDVVFMSNILHSEDEAHCAALIENCYRAVRPGGRLVIKDHLLDDDRAGPAAGAVFSLLMLLVTRGRDYSATEIGDWMTGAGFNPPTRVDLPAPFSSGLMIAEKPLS